MFKLRRDKRPNIKFFNCVPGVSTIQPILKNSDLNREWVKSEKKTFADQQSKCPIKRFASELPPGVVTQFENIINFAGEVHRDQVHTALSIGKCPGINSLMHSGYILPAPADFTVYTNGTEILKTHNNTPYPPKTDGISRQPVYVNTHPPEHTKWLKDSCKDSTNDNIVKVNTGWYVVTDPDTIFLVMKVPHVKESRFSAVTGILDPYTSPEMNVQLWWHVNEGENEVQVKAGTPLALYLPISRKSLDQSAHIVDTLSEVDVQMINEYNYYLTAEYGENKKIVKPRKIMQKYWDKWSKS